MNRKKQKTAKETKKETLANLAEKVKKAKSMAFVNYHGLGANQLNQLREKIKQAGGEFVIAKNTLIARAMENGKWKIRGLVSRKLEMVNGKLLTGPTAAVFAFEDEIAPIKTCAESFKTHSAGLFKFGFLGHELLDAFTLEALAKIPPRDELLAKVVGALNSPVYGIVSVLSANLRNLISVLDQAAQRT